MEIIIVLRKKLLLLKFSVKELKKRY